MKNYYRNYINNYYLVGEWFLGAIIIIYTLYPLFLLFINNNKDTTFIFIIFFFYYLMYKTNIFIINKDTNLATCFLSFYVGTKSIRYKKYFFFNNACLLISILLFLFLSIVKVKSFLLFFQIQGFSLFIILVKIGKVLMTTRFKIVFIKINNLSYIIYLYHHTIIKNILSLNNPTNSFTHIILILITLLLTIILKNVIKIFILLILLKIVKKIISFPSYIHPFYLKHKKAILSIDKSKNETLTNGRNYLDKCLNQPNNNSYDYINNPRISIIMPLYNCENRIEQSIRSIQYQNFKKIEIILIIDFSNNNTSDIIRNIKTNDKRIKIVDNKSNKGTLYSRSIGVLMARGKYIFNLDNDDMYFDYDAFDYIYKKAVNEKLDIVGFLTVNIYNYSSTINRMKNIYIYQYKEDLIIKQPKLSSWMIKYKGNFLVHNNII